MADHKTETRKREFEESICQEPDCEFYGLHAQQGICHSAEPEVSASTEKLLQVAESFATDLRQIRSLESFQDKDEYIRWLEAMYECAMMNWTFGLDECIRLRAELALLKKRNEP